MSNSFLERFKNKTTTISSNGELTVSLDRAAVKPAEFQLHSSIIQSANFILKPPQVTQSNSYNMRSSQPSNSDQSSDQGYPKVKSSLLTPSSISPKLNKRKKNASTTPIIAKDDLANEAKVQVINNSYEKYSKNFVPYTIRDYYCIKPKNYYQLGGLGPGNLGSEEWLMKKQLNDKRIKYGQSVYYVNAAKLPLLPISENFKLDKGETSRSRALKFARTIQRPPLRVGLSPN